MLGNSALLLTWISQAPWGTRLPQLSTFCTSSMYDNSPWLVSQFLVFSLLDHVQTRLVVSLEILLITAGRMALQVFLESHGTLAAVSRHL
jgi:hypothetical protein